MGAKKPQLDGSKNNAASSVINSSFKKSIKIVFMLKNVSFSLIFVPGKFGELTDFLHNFSVLLIASTVHWSAISALETLNMHNLIMSHK